MIFKFNQYELYFDDVLFNYNEDAFSMASDTSYVEKFIKKYRTSKSYREALLPLKLQCLLNIKDVLKGRYNSYLDLLAGIGISGKIFRSASNHLNDFSADCQHTLEQNFRVCDTQLLS
jgi:hypothetical protein